MKDPILHIKSLGHHFQNTGKWILDDINLKVERGEVVVILGENGSGKSTLLKCLSGLLTAKSGEIFFKGKNTKDWNKKEQSKNLAFVSTHNHYSSLHTVEDFVAFGRYPFTNWLGKMQEEDVRLINKMIQECDLEHLKEKNMDSLSDGERQKAIIARALTQNTPLLILDEPTTHLDVKNSLSIFQLLKKQAKEKNKAIVFSTHQLDWAIEISDKVWIVNDAKVIETSKEEFKKSKELQRILFGENNPT